MCGAVFALILNYLQKVIVIQEAQGVECLEIKYCLHVA